MAVTFKQYDLLLHSTLRHLQRVMWIKFARLVQCSQPQGKVPLPHPTSTTTTVKRPEHDVYQVYQVSLLIPAKG